MVFSVHVSDSSTAPSGSVGPEPGPGFNAESLESTPNRRRDSVWGKREDMLTFHQLLDGFEMV